MSAIAEKSPDLTVWIRAGGPAVKSEIVSFVQKVSESLPTHLAYQILVCTNPNDPILEELNTIAKAHKTVKVIFSQLSSFSSALTALANQTDGASNVLSLSVGVTIRQDQIKTGLERLTGKVKVYAWSVSGHGNDGSGPGKGWYHTAALIDKTIMQQMRAGVPKWVDNGVLGTIGKHLIGGNEEVPIMVEALQRDPESKFILNTTDPVSSSLQLGTGITFQEKLERKTLVGEHYMQKLHADYGVETDFASWRRRIWSALEVI